MYPLHNHQNSQAMPAPADEYQYSSHYDHGSASGRIMRPDSSESQSSNPPQPSFAQQHSYATPSGYSNPHYPPAQQQQSATHHWTTSADGWSHYAQPFPSQGPAQPMDMSYGGSTRAEAPPGTAHSPERTRVYDAVPQPGEYRRFDERYAAPSSPASISKAIPTLLKPKRSDSGESVPIITDSPPVPGLDMSKLLESYRFILDSSSSNLPGGRVPLPESMERMLQAARSNLQMLQTAAAQQQQQGSPNPGNRTSTSGSEEMPSAGTKRQSSTGQKSGEDGAPASETQTCLGCKATATPEWRRGPLGPRTLCNACGLVYAKMLKKRARGEKKTAGQQDPSTQDAAPEESSGESDVGEVDSFGSPERHSEYDSYGRRAQS